jgi:hypothetical protein
MIGGVLIGALYLNDLPVLYIAGDTAVGTWGTDVAKGIAEGDPRVVPRELCQLFFLCCHEASFL